MSTKKGITIKRKVQRELAEHGQYGETLDDIINRVLDEAGDISNVDPILKGSTTVKVSDETLQRIVSLKSKESESYTSVLERALSKI